MLTFTLALVFGASSLVLLVSVVEIYLSMIYLIARWFIVALSLLLAAWVIPGVEISGVYIALVTAALLGLVNIIIRPLLILLTIPITLVTMGLFILVINALLFWFVSTFVEGFTVTGFLPALGGALTVSVVSYLGNRLLREHYAQRPTDTNRPDIVT